MRGIDLDPSSLQPWSLDPFRNPQLLVSLIVGVLGMVPLALVFAIRDCAAPPRQELPALSWTEHWTGIETALLKPGVYSMGSPQDEPDRQHDETLHPVRLTRPIYVGTTEVTQAQWQTVMGANPSHFQPPDYEPCPDCPVETVNYWQVEEFLERLSSRTGHQFRLPTEAEWEVACRAKSDTAFTFGNRLTLKDANFDEASLPGGGESRLEFGRTSPVATYRPNRWGLFDVHGNVWEWTSDPLCPYARDSLGDVSERVDPRPTCDSPWKVIRGGSWYFGADSARCALRYTHRPKDLGPGLGFRVVRDLQLEGPQTRQAGAIAGLSTSDLVVEPKDRY